MNLDNKHIDGQQMKPYKGYQIDKSWKVDYRGNRIPNTVQYMVIDEDDDWIGDVYSTLAEAKAYIDEITDSSITAATKKGTVKAWVEFQKWYDGLTSKQRDKVDDIADEEGLPDYEECSDDALSWLKDEAEIVLKDVDIYNEMPEELADRPYVFKLSSTNSTYNDDILRIVEDYDGIGVVYEMLNDEGTNLYANRFYNYAVNSKRDAENIIAEVKKNEIPLPGHAKHVTIKKIDWNRCYNIYIDDYREGDKKVSWHSKFQKVKASSNVIRSVTEPSAYEYGKALSDAKKRLDDRYEPFELTRTYFCQGRTNSTGYRITYYDDNEWIADNGGEDSWNSDYGFKLYGPFVPGQIKSWSQLFKYKPIDKFKTIDSVMTYLFNNADIDDEDTWMQ